jgi:hypothetical protein
MAQPVIIIRFIALHYFISKLTVTINTLSIIIRGYWQQLQLLTITIVTRLPYTTVAIIIRFASYSNIGSRTSAYFRIESVQVLLVEPHDLKSEVHV